jgi:hypothetical protein
MFVPFPGGAEAGAAAGSTTTPETATNGAAPSDTAIDDLKRKLDELQSQLSELSKKP